MEEIKKTELKKKEMPSDLLKCLKELYKVSNEHGFDVMLTMVNEKEEGFLFSINEEGLENIIIALCTYITTDERSAKALRVIVEQLASYMVRENPKKILDIADGAGLKTEKIQRHTPYSLQGGDDYLS